MKRFLQAGNKILIYALNVKILNSNIQICNMKTYILYFTECHRIHKQKNSILTAPKTLLYLK